MNKNGSRAAALNNEHLNRGYKCIFFDLDHTLWDYEFNARETLQELHTSYNLLDMGIAFEDFHRHFKAINLELWNLYDRGLIDNEVIRTQRFTKVLGKFNVKQEKLSAVLSHEYLHGCPKKANLLPYAKEVLEYLSANYSLT